MKYSAKNATNYQSKKVVMDLDASRKSDVDNPICEKTTNINSNIAEPNINSTNTSRMEAVTFSQYIKTSKKKDPITQFTLAKYLIHISLLQLDNEKFTGAIESGKKIARINPNGDMVVFNMEKYNAINGTKKKKYTSLAIFLRLEGIKWIKKLAKTNTGIGKPPLVDAQYFMGDCHLRGMYGVKCKHKKGFAYFLQATKQNHPEASYMVALAYETGCGTKKDNKRSMQFYRKSSSFGNLYAMHRLALILQNGLLGQNRSPREAITWLKRAAGLASAEYPKPIHDLALCYENKGSSAAIPDEGYARELFMKSANYGYPQSQFKMGHCYEHGKLGCEANSGIAICWYFKAAEKNEPNAELSLSGWYLTGYKDVLEQSDAEAFKWANRSAANGLIKGAFAVGYYYEKGVGCDADLNIAMQWYIKASKGGNKRAKERLKDIKKKLRKKKRPSCIIM